MSSNAQMLLRMQVHAFTLQLKNLQEIAAVASDPRAVDLLQQIQQHVTALVAHVGVSPGTDANPE